MCFSTIRGGLSKVREQSNCRASCLERAKRLNSRALHITRVGGQLEKQETKIGVREIQEVIPHRSPFLLVDEIVELDRGKRAVGILNVTADKWFFNGHFPGRPIMPGVLIVEAMAQVVAFLILSEEENRGKLPLFGAIENCRFKRRVSPGEQLRLEGEIRKVKGSVGKIMCAAYVGQEVVTTAELVFVVREPRG